MATISKYGEHPKDEFEGSKDKHPDAGKSPKPQEGTKEVLKAKADKKKPAVVVKATEPDDAQMRDKLIKGILISISGQSDPFGDKDTSPIMHRIKKQLNSMDNDQLLKAALRKSQGLPFSESTAESTSQLEQKLLADKQSQLSDIDTSSPKSIEKFNQESASTEKEMQNIGDTISKLKDKEATGLSEEESKLLTSLMARFYE